MMTATTTAPLPCWDATYEGRYYEFQLFHRIALASCAMNRATFHVMDDERFHGEYLAAKLWGERR